MEDELLKRVLMDVAAAYLMRRGKGKAFPLVLSLTDKLMQEAANGAPLSDLGTILDKALGVDL